jgi:hypothetical protein
MHIKQICAINYIRGPILMFFALYEPIVFYSFLMYVERMKDKHVGMLLHFQS